MGRCDPEHRAIRGAPGTVGEHLRAGSEDGVNAAHQFVLAEEDRHGFPRVAFGGGITEPDPSAVPAGSDADAAEDRVRDGVVKTAHQTNGATEV